MSTTAIPAYVPRTSSLPSSAASSPNPPRRQAYVPRSSSVTPSANEEARRQAEAILKLLSSLPAPLSDKLGTTFLPVPRPQTPSPPSSSPYPSFKAYARAQKRKVTSNDDEPTYGLGLSGTGSVGSNGLPSRPPLKKARTASGTDVPREHNGGHELQRTSSTSSGLTPPLRASAHLPSPHRPARSSLRNEIKRGTSDWTKEQWSNLHLTLGRRAHSLKRAGDAYLSPATAKGHLRGRVSEDLLRGVLLLTDSLCLYLYRNFADERVASGHVRTSPYRELEGLSQFVHGRWGSLRSNPNTAEEHKPMVKGMMGLIYLIEAVTQYHVAMSELRSLHRRANAPPSTTTSGPAITAGPGGSSVSAHGPSPASSSASPGAASRSPASSAPSELPPDVLKQLSATASASTSASQALLSSRHYLSIRTLREVFPLTWNLAINSDLTDDMLPAPSDSLGAARSLDIDDPDVFAWPIELGMQNAVAHVAVFGRSLVREFAAAAGKPWEPVLSEVDSPEGSK